MKKIYPTNDKYVNLIVDDEFLYLKKEKLVISSFKYFKLYNNYYNSFEMKTDTIFGDRSILFPSDAISIYEQLAIDLNNKIIFQNPSNKLSSRLIAIYDLIYQGGYPGSINEINIRVGVTNECLIILSGINVEASINLSQVANCRIERQEDIERRITATRLVLLGPLALAFKKKKKHVQRYLTIDIIDEDDLSYTLVFTGQWIEKACSLIFNSVKESKSRSDSSPKNSIESVSKSIPEQIKEFKELLDLNIITTEEFEEKKKRLLKL